MNQGQYAQAIPFLQRALAIWENNLWPDHPDTATSLSNLAALYSGTYGGIPRHSHCWSGHLRIHEGVRATILIPRRA